MYMAWESFELGALFLRLMRLSKNQQSHMYDIARINLKTEVEPIA